MHCCVHQSQRKTTEFILIQEVLGMTLEETLFLSPEYIMTSLQSKLGKKLPLITPLASTFLSSQASRLVTLGRSSSNGRGCTSKDQSESSDLPHLRFSWHVKWDGGSVETEKRKTNPPHSDVGFTPKWLSFNVYISLCFTADSREYETLCVSI